jgi:hypothetical protein
MPATTQDFTTMQSSVGEHDTALGYHVA